MSRLPAGLLEGVLAYLRPLLLALALLITGTLTLWNAHLPGPDVMRDAIAGARRISRSRFARNSWPASLYQPAVARIPAQIDLAVLRCPRCRESLRAEGDQHLDCAQGHRFLIREGIPVLADVSRPVTPTTSLDLTVVVPARDEASNLQVLLPALQRVFRQLAIQGEVIVVGGAGDDATRTVAGEAGARWAPQREAGYGAALREGFAMALGRYLLTCDADLSHDPEIIVALWNARTDGEVVVASRYIEGGSAAVGIARRLLSRTMNRWLRRLLSLSVRDLSSGYRLYDAAVLAELAFTANDFSALEEILIQAYARGFRVQEIPFRYAPRRGSARNTRLLQVGWSYATTFARLWRLRNSIDSADYDYRAYDSVVPLQRAWQHRRHRLVMVLAAGAERVLDVGCGSSHILKDLPNAVGVDIQLHKLRYARQFGRPAVVASIFALPFADASFDCVVCSEVIEHVPGDPRLFHELARVLRPGGRLILGTPDYGRARWRFLEWFYARLAPGGYADEHITHYTRAGLIDTVGRHGFHVRGVHYVFGAELILDLRRGTVESLSRAA
jgi:dolichol-phosphate mannosyltransferase